MVKAFILSSGGLDSTTCISLAVQEYGAENVVSVSMRYGQRHSKELECAEKVADYYNIRHKVIDFTKTGIFDDSNCSLLQGSTQEVPKGSYATQVEENKKVSTYVPFRNGLFLSSIASLALSMYPDDDIKIFIGIHADDVTGSAYADCSIDFAKKIAAAIREGSYGQCVVFAPFADKTKSQVVAKGLELNTPYELTWSCYDGGDVPCGKCATCLDRAHAFAENNVADPALVSSGKEYVTWNDVKEFVDYVTWANKQNNITGVYGLPRGGLCLAVMLSHALSVPLLSAPAAGCIIVDDICDSGESLIHYRNNTSGETGTDYKLATMFYKKNALGVVPDYWWKEKGNSWIVFPWESC